jgi:hypothetical protein
MRREKLQFIYLKSTFAWDALCSGLGKRSGMYKEPPGLVRVVDNLFIQQFFFSFHTTMFLITFKLDQ